MDLQTTSRDQAKQTNSTDIKPSPPIVYGELSILGYNGYIPSSTGARPSQTSASSRRNRSKFLLCKRTEPNGIKKSRHYIVKQQPQTTKAIQDKELHSISYTFSRSQTIIVEYRQDETTDMFQIGRSSEDPIDFIVTDTMPVNLDPCNHSHDNHNQYQSSNHYNAFNNSEHHNENSSNGISHTHHNHHNRPSAIPPDGPDLTGGGNRCYRQLAKVNQNNESPNHQNSHQLRAPQYSQHDHMARYHAFRQGQRGQLLSNYPQHPMMNMPPMMLNLYRDNHDSSSSIFNQHRHQHRHQHLGHSSSISNHEYYHGQLQSRPSDINDLHQPNELSQHCQNRQNANSCKRSHASQSTISRFACRILVDRKPPYTARIYAAGFDSSKNIFLGEKATKWEQNDSIDGLTTNGVLLMHPKQDFQQNIVDKHKSIDTVFEQHKDKLDFNSYSGDNESNTNICSKSSDNLVENEMSNISETGTDNDNSTRDSKIINNNSTVSNFDISEHEVKIEDNKIDTNDQMDKDVGRDNSNSNNNNNNNNNTGDCNMIDNEDCDAPRSTGGVWREVSVDGGIYAIRESRSAAQKGIRIDNESNVLQDGTLIDLCGATLLWRSVQGFMEAPTKKSLEEKIDQLNATRPQCPVGLNTLVLPRKPVFAFNQQRYHRNQKDHHHAIGGHKKGHYPYVYLRCGHVQGYHDWGTTDKLNQRTCPICLMVGTVARLSIGLEPSFYVDTGPLTHAFNPCGHMASEKTVRYWCSIKIPHGTHFFHSICPFCATPLSVDEPAVTRLIFQHDLE